MLKSTLKTRNLYIITIFRYFIRLGAIFLNLRVFLLIFFLYNVLGERVGDFITERVPPLNFDPV
jgi:hypothetical protein